MKFQLSYDIIWLGRPNGVCGSRSRSRRKPRREKSCLSSLFIIEVCLTVTFVLHFLSSMLQSCFLFIAFRHFKGALNPELLAVERQIPRSVKEAEGWNEQWAACVTETVATQQSRQGAKQYKHPQLALRQTTAKIPNRWITSQLHFALSVFRATVREELRGRTGSIDERRPEQFFLCINFKNQQDLLLLLLRTIILQVRQWSPSFNQITRQQPWCIKASTLKRLRTPRMESRNFVMLCSDKKKHGEPANDLRLLSSPWFPLKKRRVLSSLHRKAIPTTHSVRTSVLFSFLMNISAWLSTSEKLLPFFSSISPCRNTCWEPKEPDLPNTWKALFKCTSSLFRLCNRQVAQSPAHLLCWCLEILPTLAISNPIFGGNKKPRNAWIISIICSLMPLTPICKSKSFSLWHSWRGAYAGRIWHRLPEVTWQSHHLLGKSPHSSFHTISEHACTSILQSNESLFTQLYCFSLCISVTTINLVLKLLNKYQHVHLQFYYKYLLYHSSRASFKEHDSWCFAWWMENSASKGRSRCDWGTIFRPPRSQDLSRSTTTTLVALYGSSMGFLRQYRKMVLPCYFYDLCYGACTTINPMRWYLYS